MVKRILVAVVCVPLIFVVFFLCPPIVLPIALCLLSVVAVHEVLWSTGFVKDPRISALSLLLAGVIPFWVYIGEGERSALMGIFLYFLLVGVDTVRWDFLGLPGTVLIEEIGVGLCLYFAVDGQVLHGVAAAVNVDLTQGLLRGGGGARRRHQQGQGHRQGEYQADDSFHLQTILLSKKAGGCSPPAGLMGTYSCYVPLILYSV